MYEFILALNFTVFFSGNKAPLILMDRWLALSPCIFSIYLGLTRQFIGEYSSTVAIITSTIVGYT
jgi:hypothetical protein